MLQRSLLLFSAISILVFSSCMQDCIKGSGSRIEEERTVQDFNEVVLNCSADLIINPVNGTDPLKVTVNAQENLFPYIKTTVTDNKLVVDIEGCVTNTEKIEVIVDARNLKKITNDGSGDISASGKIKVEELVVENDGSGAIELQVDLKKFKIENDGSGDLEISGDTDQLTINNDGSGNIEAANLKSNSADVKNSGSGDIDLFVRETANIRLSGSGDITYGGNPQNIDQDSSGSGKISRKE